MKIAHTVCNLQHVVNASAVDYSVERRIAYFTWARDVVAGLRGVNPVVGRAFDDVYALLGALTD